VYYEKVLYKKLNVIRSRNIRKCQKSSGLNQLLLDINKYVKPISKAKHNHL